MNALRHATLLCWIGAAHAAQPDAVPEPWIRVRSEPSATYYLDRGTVRMQGAYLTYWILVNFEYDPRFDGAEPYKSARLLRYAHCTTREQDTKSFVQHHAPMGQGEPTDSLTFDDATLRMEVAEPGSVGAQILDIACSLAQTGADMTLRAQPRSRARPRTAEDPLE